MKFDINASLRRLALMLGGAGGLLCFFVLHFSRVEAAGAWGLMVGAVLTATISLFFSFVMNSNHKARYKDIPSGIGEPICLTVNAYVTVDNISRNGFLYLTAEKLICHFRDRVPYTKMAFAKNDFVKILVESPVSIHISDAHHTFEVISTDCQALAEKMKTNGWQVTVAE